MNATYHPPAMVKSIFNPAKLCFKIKFVSYPSRVGGLINAYVKPFGFDILYIF